MSSLSLLIAGSWLWTAACFVSHEDWSAEPAEEVATSPPALLLTPRLVPRSRHSTSETRRSDDWESPGEFYRSNGAWEGDWGRGFDPAPGGDMPGRIVRANEIFGTEENNLDWDASIRVPIHELVPNSQFEERNDADRDGGMDIAELVERLGEMTGGVLRGGIGMIGDRRNYDGNPGTVFLPRAAWTLQLASRRRSDSAPFLVPSPVPHPVPVPVPVAVPQPVAIAVPVPVPVDKTVTVPVEKPVPFPVEKPVPIRIERRIPVPVPKPIPVPVPVIKYKYIYHDRNER